MLYHGSAWHLQITVLIGCFASFAADELLDGALTNQPCAAYKKMDGIYTNTYSTVWRRSHIRECSNIVLADKLDKLDRQRGY